MYKTASQRTGGHRKSGILPGIGTEAERIAAKMLHKKPENSHIIEIERKRKLMERIALRYYSWEQPGSHRYRDYALSRRH